MREKWMPLPTSIRNALLGRSTLQDRTNNRQLNNCSIPTGFVESDLYS